MPVGRVNDILDDCDYARWLGSYINKGLLHFSNFKTNQTLLSEEMLDFERHLAKAEQALNREDWEAAELALQSSFKSVPTLFNAFLTLSDLYLMKEKHSEAKDILEAVAILAPDEPSILKHLAAQYCEHDDLMGAEKALRRILAQDPEDPDVLAILGKFCLGTGRHQEAADYFKSVVLKKPDDRDAYLGLALAANELNDEVTFKMANEKAQALEPSLPRSRGLKPEPT